MYGSNDVHVHDTEAEIRFDLEVRLPRHEAIALAERMTGDDNDAILAAERALRRVIEDGQDALSQLEIWPDVDLADEIKGLAEVERKTQAIYGPPA